MYLRLTLLALAFSGLGDWWGACSASEPRVATRIFFQDEEQHALKWTDLLVRDSPFGPVSVVEGFPRLDPERQQLVQMAAAGGWLLVGVRDDEEGAYQSGWVLIETGVETEEHGDHFHWRYVRPPRVRAVQLDNQQGNPAHLYCYDGIFYLANDKKAGFTRLDPAHLKAEDDADTLRRKAQFISGGGGHITLAVHERTLAFATWIDREGPNKGRVDIAALSATGSAACAGSLYFPLGGLHGATACQNKVFFAPAEGIYWIDVSQPWPLDPRQIAIRHVSLGSVDDRPLRTGAFQTLGKYVGFVTGAGEHAQVCFADASQPTIELVRVAVKMAADNRPVGPFLIKPRRGSPLAFVFHDHLPDVEAPNRLTVLELDPNGDGSWRDARVAQEHEVGRARVEGHSGHHDLAFDADRRSGIFTNPGDGTLVLYDLVRRQPQSELRVGGIPSQIVAVGGRALRD